MKTRPRARWIALVTTIAALGLLVPVGAFGQSTEPNGPTAGGDESVLFLTRSNSDFFQWQTSDGSSFENFRTKRNDCTDITFQGPEDLVKVTATGDGVLGDVKDGFGELAPSDGNGEPCGRIDAPDQGVSVKLAGLLADRAMTRVDLDLELKFDGIATLTFLIDGNAITVNAIKRSPNGAFEPIDASEVEFDPMTVKGDNGPDSKDGDNYRVYMQPFEDCTDEDGNEALCAIFFDEVVVSATRGAVSLEGGADFESPNPPAESRGEIYDVEGDRNSLSSQFGVVRVFDGDLDCGDTVTIGNGTTSPEGKFTREDYTTDGSDCVLKLYDIDSSVVQEEGEDFNQIDFNPAANGQQARYSATLKSLPYPAANPVPQQLRYDPELDGTYTVMQWCAVTPADWASSDVDSSDVLPEGESWCVTGTSTEPAFDVDENPILDENGLQKIRTTWTTIGEGDPGFRFG